MEEARLILKRGRERSLKRKHPWIFSGAIANIEGDPGSGDTVVVLDHQGDFLGKAFFSPESEIRARVWTFKDEPIGPVFFKERIYSSIMRREDLRNTTARRLVYSESDGLPGLIIDQYGKNCCVVQFLSAGVERWKEEIVEAIDDTLSPSTIYERSDASPRKKEGLSLTKGLLYGDEPEDLIEIVENGARFLVDVKHGQKTGFYLDQRDNRALLKGLSRGKDVLNCFSYTGGFSVFAMLGGASSITDIEISSNTLKLLKKNLEINFSKLTNDTSFHHEAIKGDCFKVLRRFRDEGRDFDLIVLDPPKFAESKGSLKRACRGYKDINLLAMKLLRPKGLLLTFSCSGLMDPALFQKVVADAALDSKKEVRLLMRLQRVRIIRCSSLFLKPHISRDSYYR